MYIQQTFIEHPNNENPERNEILFMCWWSMFSSPPHLFFFSILASLLCLTSPVSFFLLSFFLAYFLVSFFLPHHAACVILVPWPGIKCTIPVVEGQSPNHWTTRKVPKMPIPNCLLDILIWISKNLKPMKYKATFLLLPVFPFSPR